jgi:CO/xanthine dehydrogenase FAD-binding subunit
MILNAVAKVATREGEREIPLQQVFEGPYQTNLKPHEILVRITFQKLPPDAMTSFVRLARREAMAIARMSVALLLQMEKGNDRIRDIRVSLGAVTPTPRRVSGVEAFLKGKSPDEVNLRTASRKVSEEMVQRAGVRPSTSYKSPVVEALFMRAFREALGARLRQVERRSRVDAMDKVLGRLDTGGLTHQGPFCLRSSSQTSWEDFEIDVSEL